MQQFTNCFPLELQKLVLFYVRRHTRYLLTWTIDLPSNLWLFGKKKKKSQIQPTKMKNIQVPKKKSVTHFALFS